MYQATVAGAGWRQAKPAAPALPIFCGVTAELAVPYVSIGKVTAGACVTTQTPYPRIRQLAPHEHTVPYFYTGPRWRGWGRTV